MLPPPPPPPPPEQEEKPEDVMETEVEMETVETVVEATPMELAAEAAAKQGMIKITNISPGASVEQMKTLFGFLGPIVELALYPMEYVVVLINIYLFFAIGWFSYGMYGLWEWVKG